MENRHACMHASRQAGPLTRACGALQPCSRGPLPCRTSVRDLMPHTSYIVYACPFIHAFAPCHTGHGRIRSVSTPGGHIEASSLCPVPPSPVPRPRPPAFVAASAKMGAQALKYGSPSEV
eukprot:82471-Chlamydomonas_euryale.AAC.3